MVEHSKVSFPLQDICMCESVSSANGQAREGTLSWEVCPREIRCTAHKPARAADRHLCSMFASDTYGRHASLYYITPTVSINCLYQVGAKCFQWWHLAIGRSETSVDLCIRLHFAKLLHKICLLWVCGDWGDEPYTHEWGYSPVESKRLAKCVFYEGVLIST